MSTEMQTKMQASPAQNFTPAQTGLLQRKSALYNTPGLVDDSKQDKEKLTLQRSSVDQAGTTTMPRFGHDFSRVSVHNKGMIQTRLKINEPGDIYEQEADRVADAVMRMPEPGVQRDVEPEEEEEERLEAPLANQITPLVQRKPDPVEEEDEEKQIQPKNNTGMAPQVTPGVAHDIHSFKGTGQPLPASERTFFEPRFGRDFSNVRVHNDKQAAHAAQSINARAYTLGNDIVFGVGHYAPHTGSGWHLMAHELTHVVQQSSAIQRNAVAPVRGLPFDNLPTELRNVLNASFLVRKFGCSGGTSAAYCFNRLDASTRNDLTLPYNRLRRFGLWRHVLYIEGTWKFIVKNHLSFFGSLLKNVRFCVDTAVGGMLHKGKTSVREISTGSSLHLTLGSSNSVLAHIDAISPVAGRQKGGLCRYDPVRAAAHIGREAVPYIIPGLQIFPEPRPRYRLPEERESFPPKVINYTVFRF